MLGVVQELPCGADEGHALEIFLLARPLADEHELGILVSDAEDEVMPPLAQGAAPAPGTFSFQFLPGVHEPSPFADNSRLQVARRGIIIAELDCTIIYLCPQLVFRRQKGEALWLNLKIFCPPGARGI